MKTRVFSLFGIVIMLLFVSFPISSLADGKYPVRIPEQNIIATPIDKNTLQIIQIVNFINSGEKNEEQLPIYLPKGYSEFEVRSGLEKMDMEVTEKGVVDKSGLSPGEEKQIVLSYTMPVNQKKSQWMIETAYVTESFQVIIQPGILSFEASDLVTQSDLFEMNNQEFRRFTRVDLHPGTPWTLRFTLIGQPAVNNEAVGGKDSHPPNFTEDGYKIIGQEGIGYGKAAVTIAIILIAISITLIGLKRDYEKSIPKSSSDSRTWLHKEKEILLQEIVQLEKDYKSSLISDTTYKATYKELRDKLKHVSAELLR